MNVRTHFLPLLCISILGITGVKALFHPGLFTAHDIWHQVARLYHYQQAVADGQFPPYWIGTLAHGLGYPLFFFSYHLPWIMALPMLSAGASIPEVIKALFILSYVSSGIAMYIFSIQLFKNRLAATLSAILYLWAPYHFSTILVSAAMGTAFVFTFLPLLFLGILKSARDKNPVAGVIITALSVTAVILSHLMSLVAILPVALVFTFWLVAKNRQRFLVPVAGVVLGIALSAFYLIPAVYYSRLTQVSTGPFKTIYQKNFVNFSQLVYSRWGYGISDSAKDAFMSFQVGIAQWLSVTAAALILFVLVADKKMKVVHLIKQRFLDSLPRNIQILVALLVAAFWLSILAMLDLSRPAWDLASKLITLDYPTMFMLPAVFAGSLAAGAVLLHVKKHLQLAAAAAIVAVALYTNRNHLRVNMYTDYPTWLYVASETTTNSFHEYLPKSADLGLFSGRQMPTILPESLQPSSIKQTSNQLSFLVASSAPGEVEVKHFSFPGINLYLDGAKREYSTTNKGTIKFSLPSGQHHVAIRFEQTALIMASKLISAVGIVCLLATTAYAKKV